MIFFILSNPSSGLMHEHRINPEATARQPKEVGYEISWEEMRKSGLDLY